MINCKKIFDAWMRSFLEALVEVLEMYEKERHEQTDGGKDVKTTENGPVERDKCMNQR